MTSIRTRRQQLGLSQAELALEAGCLQNQVSWAETGRGSVSKRIYSSIVSALEAKENIVAPQRTNDVLFVLTALQICALALLQLSL